MEAAIRRFEAGMPDNAKDRSSLSGASVAEFITALEQEGFVCARKGRVVVIADAAVAKIHDNPLDKRVPGFVFKGSHTDFLRKLASASGESGPATCRVVGGPPDAVYDISIPGEASVREVLMYVSAKYGMLWSVSHLSSPAGKRAGADGIASRWMFVLGGYVPDRNQTPLQE
jgi:hypothetical protein